MTSFPIENLCLILFNTSSSSTTTLYSENQNLNSKVWKIGNVSDFRILILITMTSHISTKVRLSSQLTNWHKCWCPRETIVWAWDGDMERHPNFAEPSTGKSLKSGLKYSQVNLFQLGTFATWEGTKIMWIHYVQLI